MTTNTNAASAEDLQDTVSKALRRAWQLGQTYWQQADSEYTSQHRKADETQGKFDALVEETRAALSTAAQPTGEPVAYLWQHSETGRTRVVMPDGVITADATWHVVGPLVLAAAPKAYAAPAPAAQPPADGALNTIAVMFHSAEEIEGPDGLAMMVDMSVWNDALDAFDEISGDEKE